MAAPSVRRPGVVACEEGAEALEERARRTAILAPGERPSMAPNISEARSTWWPAGLKEDHTTDRTEYLIRALYTVRRGRCGRWTSTCTCPHHARVQTRHLLTCWCDNSQSFPPCEWRRRSEGLIVFVFVCKSKLQLLLCVLLTVPAGRPTPEHDQYTHLGLGLGLGFTQPCKAKRRAVDDYRLYISTTSRPPARHGRTGQGNGTWFLNSTHTNAYDRLR